MKLIICSIILLVLLDQTTKYYIVNNMKLNESNIIIENFFAITSHRNRGAAWGILQDSRVFFIVVTTVLLIIVSYYLMKNKNKFNILDKLTMSLIIGGGIGNFIDRLRTGEVVDFLDFKIFNYDFPIFNLADIFICLGTFCLMIKIYKEN